MEAHGTFQQDLCSQAIIHRKWKELLPVDIELGTQVNLLDEYMMLTLDNIQSVAKTRSADKIAPARNLYLSIWNTLGLKSKSTMVWHLDDIDKDNLTLLWTLLTRSHGTAAQRRSYGI